MIIEPNEFDGRRVECLIQRKRDQGIIRRRELLAVLTRNGRAMTVAELARELGVTPAALRQSHLPRLETVGAIVREHGVVRLCEPEPRP